MRLNNKLVHELRPLGRNQTFVDEANPFLLLTVYPNGKKIWFLRHLTAIGDTLIFVGIFSEVDVSSARKKAKAMMKSIDDSRHKTGLLEREKLHLSKAQRQVSLSKLMKERDGVQFRPNPMFQPKKKAINQGSDVKRAAQEKHDFQNKQRQQEDIAAAWELYEAKLDISHLLRLLREGYFSQHPMPINMGKTIATLLEKHRSANDYFQQHMEEVDNHIFMTYWRHTEFNNGVAPLLLDTVAIDECAAFLEAIGRSLSLDIIQSRVKNGYQKWREDNAEKLKKSEKILKSLMSDQHNPDEDPPHF